MRQDCKFFESRTYRNGETVRKCDLDLAPEAPWRCPDPCPAFRPRLADVNWSHGSLVTPPTPEEPQAEGIAELLDAAEDIVNAAGPRSSPRSRRSRPGADAEAVARRAGSAGCSDGAGSDFALAGDPSVASEARHARSPCLLAPSTPAGAAAAEAFAEAALPTPEEEVWRYSPIGDLDLERYAPAPAPEGGAADGDVPDGARGILDLARGIAAVGAVTVERSSRLARARSAARVPMSSSVEPGDAPPDDAVDPSMPSTSSPTPSPPRSSSGPRRARRRTRS